MLASRSVATEPYTDFAMESVGPTLDITRTYSSADVAYSGGANGPFGPGWHDDWEASLDCQPATINSEAYCKLLRANQRALGFVLDGATSDGTEVWTADFHTRHHSVMLRNQLLARVFLPDGRELDFTTGVGGCPPCPTCTTPPPCLQGSITSLNPAPLAAVIDAAGNAISVSTDRANGLDLQLTDPLGNIVQLVGGTRATELLRDGVVVATYGYTSGLLTSVFDGDGHLMRGYVYGGPGSRLTAILDEHRNAIAEFSYLPSGDAYSVADAHSTISVGYVPTEAEYYVDETIDNGQTVSSARVLDGRGHVQEVIGRCSCGGNKAVVLIGNNRCTVDLRDDGKVQVTYEFRDYFWRRPLRTVTYAVPLAASQPLSAACNDLPPDPLPAQSTDEQQLYQVSRPVATLTDGRVVNLDMDMVTRRTRPGLLSALPREELWDYGQAGTDPLGGTCVPAQSNIPVGGVLCRQLEMGATRDASGALVSETHTTWFEHDARGRLTRKIGPLSDHPSATDVMPVEERTYYADTDPFPRGGRLHDVKNYSAPQISLATTYDYGPFGISSITEPSGAVTNLMRDSRGRVTRQDAPDGGRTETRYRNQTRGYDLTIGATGNAIRTQYDVRGRPQIVDRLDSDPEANSGAKVGASVVMSYDLAGNLKELQRLDANGKTVFVQSRDFDEKHRVVHEWRPDSSPAVAKTFSWWDTGFLSGFTDEVGRITAYAPDDLQRIARVTRRDSSHVAQVATYQYQPGSDALSSVADGNSNKTTYVHDDFDRVVEVLSPDSGDTTFAYDARGNVLHREDARTVVDYTYDGLDRLLTRMACPKGKICAGASENFAYDLTSDSRGRLSSAGKVLRSTNFFYDPVGRLSRQVRTDFYGRIATLVGTTQYRYYADGTLQELDYPSGLAVTYSRDPATREVTAVGTTSNPQAYASNVTHLPDGPVNSMTFANGYAMSSSFNRRYEPDGLWTSGPLFLSYAPTPAGDVQSINEVGQLRTFSYDFMDRLTSALTQPPGQPPGPWLSYAYDNAGNRLSETVEGKNTAYTYQAGSDLLSAILDPPPSPPRSLGGQAESDWKDVLNTLHAQLDGKAPLGAGASVFEGVFELVNGWLTKWHVSFPQLVQALCTAGPGTFATDLVTLLQHLDASGWDTAAHPLAEKVLADMEALPVKGLATTDPHVAVSTDASGNVVQLTMTFQLANGTHYLSALLPHDALNRLSEVDWQWDTSTTVVARYDYDEQGRRARTQEIGAGDYRYFYFDEAGDLLSEATADSTGALTWQRDYVWLDGRPLSQVERQNPSGSPQTYWYHVDHIGLPRALTNANRDEIWSATARPFGDITETTGTDPLSGKVVTTALRLPGQYDDHVVDALGFGKVYYNWNRWYAAQEGRFIQVDPVINDPTSEELLAQAFSYALDAPLGNVDPDGRQTFPGGCKNNPQACMPPPPGEEPILCPPYCPLPFPPTPPKADPMEMKKDKWVCVATCNVQAIPGQAPASFPERVTGTGIGPTQQAACLDAQKDAKPNCPRGTYPRHCQCSCSKV